MINRIIVNGSKEYRLAKWDPTIFNSDLTLHIQSINLLDIRNTFEHVTDIEIYQDMAMVAKFTNLDTFSSINYTGRIYVDNEKIFTDCISVQMTKANIVERVQRLDEQINPVVDVATMTLEEYKQYKIGQIHEAVHSDIYNGTQVVLSDGSVETFKFTTEDQLDIANLFNVIVTGKGKVTALPFHSTGHECRMYDAASLINLYIEMQKWITLKTTIANFAIVKVREAESKDAVDQIYYGMEFDTETTDKIDAIISATLTVINTIIEELESNPQSEDEVDDGVEE